jgi:hypothetical protein
MQGTIAHANQLTRRGRMIIRTNGVTLTQPRHCDSIVNPTPRNVSDRLIARTVILSLAVVQIFWMGETGINRAEQSVRQVAGTGTFGLLMLLRPVQIPAIWHPFMNHVVFQQSVWEHHPGLFLGCISLFQSLFALACWPPQLIDPGHAALRSRRFDSSLVFRRARSDWWRNNYEGKQGSALRFQRGSDPVGAVGN